MFHPFVEDSSVRLIGVEAAEHWVVTGRHDHLDFSMGPRRHEIAVPGR